jgi:hypothetical protein
VELYGFWYILGVRVLSHVKNFMEVQDTIFLG